MKFLTTLSCMLLAMGAGADIFIDFEKGNDRNNGEKNAPLKTFPEALKKAVPGNTIYLLPASKPINTSLIIRNIKGTAEKPIVIDGMFNTIYGAVQVTENNCREVSPGLYLHKLAKPLNELLYLRYFLCFDGKMERMGRNLKFKKPEFKTIETLQPGEWTLVNNIDVYFKFPAGKNFGNTVIEEPKYISGVELSGDCDYLTIRNLIVKSFWNDGYNIHNKCRNIRFENVAAVNNADDGISAHEDCQIFVKNMVSIGNGTGFCHIDRAECHHENIYIAECTGRDILVSNAVSTLKNIIVEGSALGRLEFNQKGKNTLEDCYFLNLRPGNSIRGKDATMDIKNSWYCDYQVTPNEISAELKPMEKEAIKAKIKEQRDGLFKLFGGRIPLPESVK